MNYKLPKQAREFVLFQRTNLLPKFNLPIFKKILKKFNIINSNKEYKEFVKSTAEKESSNVDLKYFEDVRIKANTIIKHIPESTSSILDIGCGIAGLDLIFNEFFNLSKIYLLDKTKTEEDIWYGFKKSGAFYNSLELAKETLVLNSVDRDIIELIDAPDDGKIPLEKESVDLVISTISWGFHYPINFYLKSVFNLLNKDGLVILDLRLGKNMKKEISDLSEFFNVEVICKRDHLHTIKCTKK